MTLAEHLKSRRLDLGFSQDRLAGAARLSKRTVARIEAGHPVQADTLLAICSVLRIDHADAEAMRRAEKAEHDPAIETLVPESSGTSREILPAALAALSEAPDVRLVALPDLAAWRGAHGPGRGADLSRPVFARKARFWERVGKYMPAIMLAGVVGPIALAAGLEPLIGKPAIISLFVALPFIAAAVVAFCHAEVTYGLKRAEEAATEERLARTAYAFSEGSVREVLVLDDEVRIRRYDLDGKRRAERKDCGGRASYDVHTRTDWFAVHAVPRDERIDAILLRTGPGDVVRRIPRTLSPAA